MRWKTQKKAITPFKVIQGHQGRYQSKARMRLIPISDNCFFSLHVTAEALRGKIDRKSAISLQRGHFDTNFQDVPINNYAWIVRPCHTTLPLTVFTLRNFVADFRQAKCDFRGKTAVLRFELPFEGLRGNARWSSWACWKPRRGLPISVNWTFFARSYGWGATNENRSKIGDFAPTRSL